MAVQAPNNGIRPLEPKVMVLDDNLPVYELYCTVLSSEGFDVESLQLLSDMPHWEELAPFDILITELIVDGRETLSLIKEVKSRYPETYVIVATRYDIADDIYPTLFAQGVDDVLSKPFSNQVLLASLTQAVGCNGTLHPRFLN